MGSIEANIGQKMKPVGIEKYRGSLNQSDIVSIISSKVRMVAVHYHKNVGYVFCNKGTCCSEIGVPTLRYIHPVLVYTTKKFPHEYGAPVELKYISVGRKLYENTIMILESVTGGISNVDLIATCTDEKYQSLTFQQIGPAKWRKDPAMKAQVEKLWVNYNSLIDISIARTLTEEQLQKALYREDGEQGQLKPYSQQVVTPQRNFTQGETQPLLPLDSQTDAAQGTTLEVEDFGSLLDDPVDTVK